LSFVGFFVFSGLAVFGSLLAMEAKTLLNVFM